MKSLVIAAFLAMGVAMPVSAQVQYIYCEMTDLGRSGNYIPPKSLIKVDLSANTAEVVNPPMRDARNQPLAGTITLNSDSRIEMEMGPFSYKNSSGQFSNFTYIATWIKRTGRGTFQALPSGYPNRWVASGACRLEQ